jgi:hypothetical protein
LVTYKSPPTHIRGVHHCERGRPMRGGEQSPSEAHGRRRLHRVCLAAHVSGGLKSHSTCDPRWIAKGGGKASPAGERGRYGAPDTGTTAKAGHRQGGPGATSCRTPEGRALAVRRGPQGLRRTTGSSSRGDIPRMNRSAQDGEWSSRHDGGEGMRVPPHRTTVCAGDTVGKTAVCPREAWYRPSGRYGRDAVTPADDRAGQRGPPRAT